MVPAVVIRCSRSKLDPQAHPSTFFSCAVRFFFRPTPLGFRQVVQHVTQTNTELANEGQERRLGSFAARSSHLFQAIAGLSGATFATPGSRTKFKLLLLKSASNLLHFNKVATMGTLVSDRLPVVFCSRPQTRQKITARTKNLQKWKTNAMSSYLRVQRECRRYRNLRNLLGSASRTSSLTH